MAATTTMIEVCLGLCLVGCGAPDPDEKAASGPVTSEHGLFVGELSFQPDPPSVGENSLELWLESAGVPVTGALVNVETYMPAHGHLNQAGTMLALEPGSYRTDHVVYNMPGTWELTLNIAAEAGTDRLVVDYDVH